MPVGEGEVLGEVGEDEGFIFLFCFVVFGPGV